MTNNHPRWRDERLWTANTSGSREQTLLKRPQQDTWDRQWVMAWQGLNNGKQLDFSVCDKECFLLLKRKSRGEWKRETVEKKGERKLKKKLCPATLAEGLMMEWLKVNLREYLPVVLTLHPPSTSSLKFYYTLHTHEHLEGVGSSWTWKAPSFPIGSASVNRRPKSWRQEDQGWGVTENIRPRGRSRELGWVWDKL